MYKIGVVGLHSSIALVLELTEEYREEYEFISLSYESPEEVIEIMQENNAHVHAWLFTGPLPYEIAKKNSLSDKIMVPIPATESGLYKSFLEMIYEQGTVIEKLSIDTMTVNNISDESWAQLSLPLPKIYTKIFDLEVDMRELYDFHVQLWNDGKIDGVLTCFPAVCEALREQGIPAYRMSMSRMEIRYTLQILSEKVKAAYFKDTQIGVEIIEIEYFSKVVEEMKTPYHLMYLELRLKELLIQLGEKINGSILEKGNGSYMIFSSRGAIEREISSLEETIQNLAFVADTTVSVGIGFGETAFAAEINAIRAIKLSKEMNKREIVIVQADGKIVESPGKKQELQYASRSKNERLIEKLKNGNISVKTYKKIVALIEKMGWSSFTTKDVANYLEMTERNVRRIVSDMCEVGLAQCIGSDAPATRGRPSKIYKLL